MVGVARVFAESLVCVVDGVVVVALVEGRDATALDAWSEKIIGAIAGQIGEK